MNPSKENARKAQEALARINDAAEKQFGIGGDNFLHKDIQELYNFLRAAERKLPTEASIARDKARPRKAKSK